MQMSRLSHHRLLLRRRRRTRLSHVSKPTLGPVDAEPELVHVTILDVLQRVLVRTVRLLTLAVFREEPTRGHARFIELVQEPARVPLHAQIPQPVSTHRLSVILSPALVQLGRRRLRLSVVRVELILEIEIDVEIVHGERRRGRKRARNGDE